MFFSCTENPFNDDKKIENKTISGYVKLDRVDSYPAGFHGGVFVWSDGLSIRTKTDVSGYFELELPLASDPLNGAIVDGDYKIHFFLGNYKVSNITVTFAKGQIVNDDKLINRAGELLRDVIIEREFGYATTIIPEIIPKEYNGLINVLISLEPSRDDIIFKLRGIIIDRDNTIYTGLLIKDIDSDKLIYSVNIDSAKILKEYMRPPKKNIQIDFEYNSINLPKGNYEVIPYLLMDGINFPSNLNDAIGIDVENFSEEYLNYPLYRIGGKFVVE